MKYHLRNWKCHYYSYEGGGSKKTILSLIKHVTLSLRRVGVKGISDNVTKYDVFRSGGSLELTMSRQVRSRHVRGDF